jgi:DEAD/DEAH box helicase domain-containing protein
VPANVSTPALTVGASPTDHHALSHVDLDLYSQSRLVTVNDNFGRGYLFVPEGDGSYTTTPGARGASSLNVIGEVRVTDALLLTPSRLKVPTGAVSIDDQPSGRAAYTSLAEVLRRGAQVFLDLDPSELSVGLTPVRLPLNATNGTVTSSQVAASIYLADTAENGAGYAVELGSPETFGAMMKATYWDITTNWEAPKHAGVCDTSCPDCLRSYDNARRHSQLDWRLATDMLELALGMELDLSRSLTGQVDLLAVAADGLGGAAVDVLEGLPIVSRGNRCVILTHPLWRTAPAFFNEQQSTCYKSALEQYSAVAMLDIRSFRLNPLSAWPRLQG